jgi:hypothetical protein
MLPAVTFEARNAPIPAIISTIQCKYATPKVSTACESVEKSYT